MKQNRMIKEKVLSAFCLCSVFFFHGIKASAADCHTPVETFPVTTAHLRESEVRVASRFWEFLFGEDEPSPGEDVSDEKKRVYVGGQLFGVRVFTPGVRIEEVDAASVSEEEGLRVGDTVLRLNGIEVQSAAQFAGAVRACGGEARLNVLRAGEEKTLTLHPQKCGGEYRLGVRVKSGTAGIGTVTYYDPETGVFGGLGHGITDSDGEQLLTAVGGDITGVLLGGVKRGEAGAPGELHGALTGEKRGELLSNTACGIFGTYQAVPADAPLLEVAKKGDVHPGEATVISSVHTGQPQAYHITISDIDVSNEGTKSFTVRVTDDALIAMTGGIVRGMSGSPILQDGKLIGALTHVMVSDPTAGYGIFLENMLNAMPEHLSEAA